MANSGSMSRGFHVEAYALCFFLTLASCTTVVAEENVRKSAFAGKWYPAEKVELEKQLDGFIADAGAVSLDGEPVGLVCPHAGYTYCGRTGAHGYALLKGREYTRVIIMAPNHQQFLLKGICVSSFDAYETPLGKVPVDKAVCDELGKKTLFRKAIEIEQYEHSAEMQVPFLQRTVKNLKIVPLIVGVLAEDEYKAVADAIRPFIDDKTLVIASSDFTHYGPRFGFEPFGAKDDLKDRIRALDQGAIDEIVRGNSADFRKYIEKTGATICGHNPIAVLLELFPGHKGKLLNYSSSAEVAGGNYAASVSYAAIALTRPAKTGLSDSEKKTLLKLARDTLQLFLEKKGRPDPAGYELTPRLKEWAGAFVTLKNRGDLRGCVGYMEGIKPLWETVVDNAINAAEDRRFLLNPVTLKETKEITIEISVLSPRTKVARAEDIVIGTHGVEIQKGGLNAVFLPQVAPEQGWDRATMLEHLCLKAGLGKDDWKSDATTFMVFTAEVFSESEMHK